MKLIIGGYASGKLDYVKDSMLSDKSSEDYAIYDGKTDEFPQTAEGTTVLYNFHYFIKKSIKSGKLAELEANLDKLIKSDANIIIISDEIGNGIVPMDAFEREYREKTGRFLIEIAAQADEVIRVICRIGQKIK